MTTRKKLLLILLSFLGLIVLLIISFFSYIKLSSGDIEKIDDSILQPSSQILSKEDNSYYDLKQASDSLVLSQDENQAIANLSNGTNWDNALANQIVVSNERALTAFERASWKKGYQDPIMQDDLKTFNVNTVYTGLADIRKIAQISAIKSRILFKQGKEKESFDNVFNILYFGQAFQNSPRENLLNYIVSVATKDIGLNALQTMISQSHLSSVDLKNYVMKLDKFKNNKTGLQEVFRMEYTMLNNTKEQMIDPFFANGDGALLAQTIEHVSGEPLPFNLVLLGSDFYYKPNETQKLYTEQYQNFVNDAVKKCSDIQVRPKRVSMSFMSVMTTENAVGKILTDVLESSLGGVFDKRCQEEFSVIKTQIALASQAYKNDNGAYPASFDLLSPNYLNTIDKQYDGKDIVYNANNGTVSLAQ